MKTITANFKGIYKQIILGPLFKLFEAVLEVFVPLIMADIIDVGVYNKDVNYVIKGMVLMLVLAAFGAAASLTCQYFAAQAGGHFGRKLRGQIFKHVMQFQNKETTKFGTSGLITRMTNDVNMAQTALNMVIRLGTRVPFLTIGSIVMAMGISFKIGGVFVVAAPLIIVVLILVVGHTLPGYLKIQDGQDKISLLASENLDGVRVIRAFSRQEDEKAVFENASDEMTSLLQKVGKISAALNPITSFVANIAIVAIVWLGAKFAFAGEIMPGAIIALVSYMNQILLALLVASQLVILFTRGIASARRVANVLETKPSIASGSGAKPENEAPFISFKDVGFAYYKEASNALNGITFDVEKGQTVGIIGGTGSGKSTLVNLLIRQADVTNGEILLNGENIKKYTLQSLREKIGMVPQKAGMFSGSVRYNLQIGLPCASDDELWRALEFAKADFVKKMDGELDAKITDGGANLSGGQKQRLSIARAIIRKPQLLILDDASSALDYATDAALRKEIKKLTTQKLTTVIIISQRAAALKSADLILVMEDGTLAAKGTHDELMQKSEVYKEICFSQSVVSEKGASSP